MLLGNKKSKWQDRMRESGRDGSKLWIRSRVGAILPGSQLRSEQISASFNYRYDFCVIEAPLKGVGQDSGEITDQQIEIELQITIRILAINDHRTAVEIHAGGEIEDQLACAI